VKRGSQNDGDWALIMGYTFGRLFALVFLLPSSKCSYGGHDLFTSLGQLNELWKNERAVVADMEEAIGRMEDIKESFKK
jgi:hypothetical protein